MAKNLPVTRERLGVELAKNAATEPWNIAVPAVVILAGIALNALWLIPVAVVIYAAMAVATFLNGNVAQRVGEQTYAHARGPAAAPLSLDGLDPRIAQPLAQARDEEAKIRAAVASANLPFADVNAEIESLMRDTETVAQRAQSVSAYLSEQDTNAIRARIAQCRDQAKGSPTAAGTLNQTADALEEQLQVIATLEQQYEQLVAQLDHLAATLAVVRGQLVRMGVTEETDLQDQLATEVRGLREELGAAAQGMDQAFSNAAETPPLAQKKT